MQLVLAMALALGALPTLQLDVEPGGPYAELLHDALLDRLGDLPAGVAGHRLPRWKAPGRSLAGPGGGASGRVAVKVGAAPAIQQATVGHHCIEGKQP